MNNIILNNGDGVTVLDSTNTKAVPVDGEGRGIVNTYEDIVNIRNPYLYMRVIVRNDSQDGTHLKGEYIITSLTNIGKVDASGIKSFKDYVGESDPTVPAHVKEITQQNIMDWNNKSNFNGDYNNLTNKPTIPDVSNKVDKEPGKGLSTNDYDNTEKEKVTKAIQTPSISDAGKIPVMRNNGIVWEAKPTNGENGLSAFQLAQQEGFSGDINAWLDSLKATIGAFKFVATDSTALNSFSSIGDSYNGTIDGVIASSDTKTTILLMNDANPANKTIMIATEDNGNNGYQFVYAGDLNSAIPSNILTEARVDNTMLVNPTTNALVKASDVMKLKAKLEGVTAIEDKEALGTKENGAINGSTGLVLSSGQRYEITLPNGVKKVRFLGAEASSSSYPYGFAFYDDAETPNVLKCELYRINGDSSTRKHYEIISEVPNGAKTFKFSLSSLNTDIAYCYLQSGKSVMKMFNELNEDLYGYGDNSVVSEIDYASVIADGNIALDITTSNGGSVTRGGNARAGSITKNAIGSFLKIKIIGMSSAQRATAAIFTKKTITDLANGTYTYQDLKDGGYLCDGITSENWITSIPSTTADPDGVDIDIPSDAKYVYIKRLRNDNYSCAPSSVLPFSQYVKGYVEEKIDEKLEDYTPINVIDSLESDSETDALSAKQGKVLSEKITKLVEVVVFKLRTYSVNSSGNWGTSTDYAHGIIPVKEGETYRLYNEGSSDNMRYALLTSNVCTAGEAMPLVNETSVVTINSSKYEDITIPNGCKYLVFMEDKPGLSNSYYPRLYKILSVRDKEFYEDDLYFNESLPPDALTYHAGWYELVDSGIVERSEPTYMDWDTNHEYPLYTYRIKRQIDWMQGYYPNQYDGTNYNYYRRKIMITCGIHGSERLTPNTFLKWLKANINNEIFATFNFVIIPLCNPWGYSHTLLKNGSQTYDRMGYDYPLSDSSYTIVKNTDGNGYWYGIRRTLKNAENNYLVDINRDFTDEGATVSNSTTCTRFLTTEAQYIRDIYIAEKPDMVIDFHQDLNSGQSDGKCGFINCGPSNVQAIRDKLLECRRKAFIQINKAGFKTDNKYRVGTEQYSYTWGGIYPESQEDWATAHESNWHNYASGGSGNILHTDCAVRYSFTAETDVYCKKLNGTNTPNNKTAKQYGYEFMTNFLSYIFDVFDMNDLDKPVITSGETNTESQE